MARAIFHPQAWIDDNAVEVDPQGPTDFDVGDVPDTMRDNSTESDDLALHPNAPEWVRLWSGPFYIEIERDGRETPEEVHPVTDWQYEVASGDTMLGYRDWLAHQIEADTSIPKNGEL